MPKFFVSWFTSPDSESSGGGQIQEIIFAYVGNFESELFIFVFAVFWRDLFLNYFDRSWGWCRDSARFALFRSEIEPWVSHLGVNMDLSHASQTNKLSSLAVSIGGSVGYGGHMRFSLVFSLTRLE